MQIMCQHFKKAHNFWFIICKSKHNYTKSILKLSMFVEMIQYNIWIYIFTELNIDSHTFTAGFISDVCNSINFLFFYKFRDFFNQTGFVNHIWKFCNNDTILSICHRFDICDCTYTNLTTSGTICFFNSSGT